MLEKYRYWAIFCIAYVLGCLSMGLGIIFIIFYGFQDGG